jgi:hypothetical protein
MENSVPEEARQPDWTRVADGRPWRLKAGRDFTGSISRMKSEARIAAREQEKVVIFTKDTTDPTRFAWVQFADGVVPDGQPCPRCGGYQFALLSTQFVRCTTCDAQLVVQHLATAEDVELQRREAAHAADGAVETLGDYSGIHLSLAEADATSERFIGYGFDANERLTLLFVVAPLAGGKRIPEPSSPTGFLHTLSKAIGEPFGDGIDFSDLRTAGQSDWDITVP